MSNKKEHWENVFSTKSPNEVSWTQEYPKTAIDYLENLNLPKSAHIIDIGGGESNFVDAVLELGYTNISVLDISAAALDKAKIRLGEKANQVNWIVSDITEFESEIQYDFWYDRAVFHFLTDEISIDKYKKLVEKSIAENGHFLLGTFSENGPLKCSGLEIMQYSEPKMKDAFTKNFKPLKCFTETHTTPFNTTQDFQFCGFTKKQTVENINLNTIITCPQCNHTKSETMLIDACQYFYECENCKEILKPLNGDCCVYCSYGSIKCPPIQEGNNCCKK